MVQATGDALAICFVDSSGMLAIQCSFAFFLMLASEWMAPCSFPCHVLWYRNIERRTPGSMAVRQHFVSPQTSPEILGQVDLSTPRRYHHRYWHLLLLLSARSTDGCKVAERKREDHRC